MDEVQHFAWELQDLASRYQGLPQSLRDGLEQLIDSAAHHG